MSGEDQGSAFAISEKRGHRKRPMLLIHVRACQSISRLFAALAKVPVTSSSSLKSVPQSGILESGYRDICAWQDYNVWRDFRNDHI
jgi:hypothetical protein